MPEEIDDATSKDTADFDINSVKDASKISLNIGYGLVTLVSKTMKTVSSQVLPS